MSPAVATRLERLRSARSRSCTNEVSIERESAYEVCTSASECRFVRTAF
ncbi:hypothetical protein [Halococcus sediminicola]|nr:hypothetical protein [Halococcus sediminicola]